MAAQGGACPVAFAATLLTVPRDWALTCRLPLGGSAHALGGCGGCCSSPVELLTPCGMSTVFSGQHERVSGRSQVYPGPSQSFLEKPVREGLQGRTGRRKGCCAGRKGMRGARVFASRDRNQKKPPLERAPCASAEGLTEDMSSQGSGGPSHTCCSCDSAPTALLH